MIPIRIDRDQWGEITESLMRNKTRAFLTAFGINGNGGVNTQ